MTPDETQVSDDGRRKASRRDFLQRAAASGLTVAARAHAQQKRASNGPVLAYVGTYSSPQGPEGSRGRGEGIYLFEMDPSNGNLKQRELFPEGMNPSCLALDPSRTHLYAANETSTFEGAASGSVSAFSIERSTGRLTLLNTVSSQGAGPAHLSVHPSGRYVLVANYAGGTIAALPIRPGGSLGAARLTGLGAPVLVFGAAVLGELLLGAGVVVGLSHLRANRS